VSEKIYGEMIVDEHFLKIPLKRSEIKSNWFTKIPLKEKMKIVEFYRGERGNTNGDTLDEIMSWTDGQLEMDHDWIQWALPSNERSMLNGDAPTMTKDECRAFNEDVELQEKARKTFERFLDFLGFRLTSDPLLVEPKDENVPWFLRSFNHNMLRVTRSLKSMRLTGNTECAVAFYNALRPFFGQVSENTRKYWGDAIFAPLWPKVINLS
jgi:hypothetical protein